MRVRAILFLLIVLYPILLVSPELLAADDVRWVKVNLPAEGSGGGWVLAKGSDVRHLTLAADGTLYAFANPVGTNYRLFKSKDKGVSWAYVGQVTDTIIDIAAAPDNASVLYYATISAVYRSVDGGNTFVSLPPAPGGAGSGNVAITSLDVARMGGSYIIAVSIRDGDGGQFGGIYTLDEMTPLTWTTTALGSYDAYAISFSPAFPADRQLVGVVTDEVDSFVFFKTMNQNWGESTGNARFNRDNLASPPPLALTGGAAISFPADYSTDPNSGNCILFAALNAGGNGGDVYRINGVKAPGASLATDLNIGTTYGLANLDVGGLASYGKMPDLNLFAGTALGSQVYRSRDAGRSWERSAKEPTGESLTFVLPAPDFAATSRVYAATSGSESALSGSVDGGLTFSQLSLIDTYITAGGILDLAPSSDYPRDSTIFVLTSGAEQSLWLSKDSGTAWERIFSSAPPSVDYLRYLRLSPDYGWGSEALYLTGSGGGSPAIWKSTDGGRTFNRYPVPRSIDALVVADKNSLFIAAFDGLTGLIYHSTSGGFFFDPPAICGTQRLSSLALSPAYEKDKVVLAGNTGGGIYLSTDNGASFIPLPPTAATPPLSGNISIAFDPRFGENKLIYAGSSTDDKGIFRFAAGKSTFWERIDSSLPSGSSVRGLAVAAGGTLYAANLKADSGVERSLDPDHSLSPTFERFSRGLESGARLDGIWLSGNRVWVLNRESTSLFTLQDSLALAVRLSSPADKASGVGFFVNHSIKNVNLDWGSFSGATSYRWQLDTDNDLSSIPGGFEGETGASSVALPALESATTYYWRVRVSQPVASPWSEKWSFTTSLGEAVSAPELKVPAPAAREVPVAVVFSWTGITGAEGYEFVAATNPSFSDPIISRSGEFALLATAWEGNIRLEYGTTYYWKVRAVSSRSKSAWSAVSAFTTQTLSSPSPVLAPLSTASPEPLTVSAAPAPPPTLKIAANEMPDSLLILIAALIISVATLAVTVAILSVRLVTAYQTGKHQKSRRNT